MIFYPSSDLWSYLQSTEKTVVMYGMGNGADKILKICERYDITIADFFASDEFVRGHSFHGKTVLRFSDIKEKYGVGNIIVLLSFGSALPNVLEQFYHIAKECELYAPDVPVCGNNLFDLSFFHENRQKIEEAYSLLYDEESKKIYRDVISYKLSGDISYLRDAESDKEEVYRSLLAADSIRAAADLGAYNGDTIRELKQFAPNLQEVWAMEPDRRNFRKLNEYASTAESLAIHAIHAAAWSEETVLSFADSGNRNSGAFAKGRSVDVPALPLDSVLASAKVDYIKYDVEGAEAEALRGSAHTIRTYRPRLLISAYHRSEDIFELPLYIHHHFPAYRLYLRRYPYVPAWDLNLICI